MRSNLEFRSSYLNDPASRVEEPCGQTIARLLRDRLPDMGFTVTNVFAEDWGWHVAVANEDFPLWIGCGRYEEWDDGLLCFIEPRKPYVCRWLKRLPTSETVERLATALETIIRDTGEARDLRWWTDEENASG